MNTLTATISCPLQVVLQQRCGRVCLLSLVFGVLQINTQSGVLGLSLSPVTNFGFKSVLSGMSIVTPAFLLLVSLFMLDLFLSLYFQSVCVF